MKKTELVSTLGIFALATIATVVACDDSTSSGANPSDDIDGGGAGPGPGSSGDGGANAPPARYVLGSVTIDAEGKRVSYAQIVDKLEGNFTNANGVEVPGNATFLAHGSNFFYGLEESPEWVRYSTKGGFKETGRLSFLEYGISYMDFANTIVDDETAVSVLTEAYVAVIWNPATMEIKGTVPLTMLQKEGYSLEAFTTVTHNGLVYIPGKWVNWDTATIMQKTTMTVLDPKTMTILGTAEDDRCGAGGRVLFDDKGYAYVLGDGRNQSMQEFAKSKGQPTVPNCLLRIAPGTMDFEENWFYQIPGLTGGLDAMTELEGPSVQTNFGFTMMQYPDRIPAELDRVNFEHWTTPAYKMWRIALGDVPKAEEVTGANFSVVGFSGSGVGGKFYYSESADGAASTVYELDPIANTSTQKFTMVGYFSGIYPITE